MTLRALDRWIPDGASVLDVGVGVGHYALHLAKRDCQLHLADICESFLKTTLDNLDNSGYIKQVLSAHRASATDLTCIENQSVDAVLMLGPFYHLQEKSHREKAVAEAYRVLKPGGILFAAGINRLAIFKELFRNDRFFNGAEISLTPIQKELLNYCESGVSNKDIFPPLGDAYCATQKEFEALFETHFNILEFLGIESFAAFNQKKLFEKAASEQKIWLDFLGKMASTEEGIASAEHFLFVGQKGAAL